jgi:hypothetical protein
MLQYLFASEREKIYKWLDSIIPSRNYSEALERRFEHTGTWFFDSAAFAQWKQTGGSFLWIHGIRESFMKYSAIECY